MVCYEMDVPSQSMSMIEGGATLRLVQASVEEDRRFCDMVEKHEVKRVTHEGRPAKDFVAKIPASNLEP